ncbi:MAG: hypothetical protein ACUVTN_05585 [Thermodesulfobacteriota bacterium]
MNGIPVAPVCDVKEGVRGIEINIKRVIELSLAFTNIFFVSYFFLKLFHLI